MRSRTTGLAIGCVLLPISGTYAQPVSGTSDAGVQMMLSPAELFAFGDSARDTGDVRTAEKAYRALATNPDPDIRTESRFRLAMMLAEREKRYREAAVLLRQILDEKPGAGRVRIELARMQAMMGHIGAAERELRAAAATDLPADVAQLVRFYASVLSAQKPVGASFEVALAPDTNVNRATRSDTLGTVIGDFILDEDAKARSGIGLSARGQGFVRTPIDRRATLLARVAGATDLYGQSRFDNIAVSAQVGPEYISGRDRIAVIAGPGWRWYGLKPYSFSITASGSWLHPVGRRTQLRAEGGLGWITNRFNALQSGANGSLGLGIDHAWSPRFGIGVQAGASREGARDPGFATTTGSISGYAFRELGSTTAVLSASYGRLDSDERLLLYPRRRTDDRVTLGLSGTFRAARIGSLAPFAKVQWERNSSTVAIFEYSRLSAQLGVTAGF